MVAIPAKCLSDAKKKCGEDHERSVLTGELFTSSNAIITCMIIQSKHNVELKRAWENKPPLLIVERWKEKQRERIISQSNTNNP